MGYLSSSSSCCAASKDIPDPLSPHNKISAAKLGFKKLCRYLEIVFSNHLLHLHLFDRVYFKYSQVLVIFLFSDRSNAILI